MHVEERGVVNRPVEKVFDYVADPVNLPEWSAAAVEVRDIQHTNPGKLGEGDTFTPVHKLLGKRIEEHVEVTAYEPNRHVRNWSTGGPMPLEVNYIFEVLPRGGGTRLTVGADTQSEGFFRLIGPVFRIAFKRQIGKDLDTLKDILEGRS